MTRFIGQDRIIRELNFIIPLAKEGQSFNILFSARSGYGKTFLGLEVIRRVATNQVIISEDAESIIRRIEAGKTRANLIDEVHLVKNIELLYPMMDSKTLFLVFATNQSYDLPEAFHRRCIPLIFERYSLEELVEIARGNLQGLRVDKSCLDEIVRCSNYTPGNIHLLCLRLRTVFSGKGGFNLKELKDVLINIFNIVDGLDPRCREYLEVLEKIEVASLETMAYVLGVSKYTVKMEVEGVLLSKGLIQITPKGRMLKKGDK